MKKVAFLFPGQGSQAVGMGQSFIERSDQARQMCDQASQALGYDMAKLLFEEDGRLGQTAYTQPAILFVSLLAHRIFESELPIKPIYAMGHSLGELSAVTAMGGLSLKDALTVAAKRGSWMQEACSGVEAGMMVLLGLEDETAQALCQTLQGEGRRIWPANYNSKGQIVLAGLKPDLEASADRFKEAGAKRAMLLDMSVASHCPLLSGAVEPLKALLEEKLTGPLMAPVVANATGERYTAKADAVRLLASQLIEPVHYKQAIAAIEEEVEGFIEFGHGGILKGLNRKITTKPTLGVGNMDELEQVLDQLKGGA